MICAHCRAENPADNTYCGQCGSALAEDAAPPRYPDRASLIRREIVIVAVGLLTLLAASYGVWLALYYRNSPESVVRQFIEADLAGRLDQQSQYVSSRADSRLILAAVQEFRRLSSASLFQDYRILGSTTRGQSATVSVLLTLPPPTQPPAPPTPGMPAPPPANSTFPVTFSLIREDNEWKIDPTQTLSDVAGTLLANGYQNIQKNLPNLWPPPTLPVIPIPSTPAPGGSL
jgi:hypothetical protein